MNREIEYLPEEECDVCGNIGAFDFMGDFLCSECANIYIDSDDSEY